MWTSGLHMDVDTLSILIVRLEPVHPFCTLWSSYLLLSWLLQGRARRRCHMHERWLTLLNEAPLTLRAEGQTKRVSPATSISISRCVQAVEQREAVEVLINGSLLCSLIPSLLSCLLLSWCPQRNLTHRESGRSDWEDECEEQ